MDQPLADRVAAVAALDEPTRRRLYEHVVRHPTALSRDEIATALGIPRATAAFHLEKLVGEDLLDVGYERRNGRSGPGAGRPAKVYRRSARSVAVHLPDRRYDLAGHLLATAVEEADRTGQPVRATLERHAYRFGRQLGENADELVTALEEHGFEPRAEGDQVLLGNCPFHTLAREHTRTICAMNLHLLDGLLAGMGDTGLTACLDPQPGQCCVRLEPRSL
ncbi:transcriptional regulator [Actinosynnema sp. ALI-1.44]|uniref:helix-turn-helix transcriptional regulator n=1 Tax=Actinosynnema sp. ALI-1.44 TaxID=1933779 RepID=UPI00097CB147|nr:helix-turn-helix domain-containing protein [Actinosynnema sp. ALI-1.44]ONI76029.1 transcriptional regulator [Actinosynnema sp. ALI-1.44]